MWKLSNIDQTLGAPIYGAYGSSGFLIGQNGLTDKLQKSEDGINWDIVSLPSSLNAPALFYQNNRYIIAPNTGGFYTSNDLNTFSYVGNQTSIANTRKVIYKSGVYHIASANNQSPYRGLISTTTDFINFTNKWVGLTGKNKLYGFAHDNNNIFVACGDYGKVYTSVDNGETYTEYQMISDSASSSLRTAIWSGTHFIIASYNGGIYRSTDGISWSSDLNTTGVSDIGGNGYGMTIYKNKIYVVSSNGKIIVSSDHGATWSIEQNLVDDTKASSLIISSPNALFVSGDLTKFAQVLTSN